MTKQNIEIKDFPASDLHFDRRNPRLVEFGISDNTTEVEILKILWDGMDVREIVQSIVASGFFRHEPLIVAQEANRLIVIEGNRRLAAVRSILEPHLLPVESWRPESIPDTLRADLQNVPCIVSSRSESWRYIGFRHVNGPAKWGSYAKAAYIAGVRKTYGISLKDIAEQIGDRHRTVERLYRGFVVLEQAEQDGVFDREDRFNARLAFSHLYTGLEYESFANFIGISEVSAETIRPVPSSKREALEELMLWLYGSKKQGVAPKIESQNPDLRNLRDILSSKEALSVMRSTGSLALAFESTRPPKDLFDASLISAKQELTNARKHLTLGYDLTDDILKIANDIAILAQDLYEEMSRKRTTKNQARRKSIA
jgi:hypothetical protein